MLHAGLDPSRRKVDVCLIAEAGEIVDEWASPADVDGLRGPTGGGTSSALEGTVDREQLGEAAEHQGDAEHRRFHALGDELGVDHAEHEGGNGERRKGKRSRVAPLRAGADICGRGSVVLMRRSESPLCDSGRHDLSPPRG